MCDDPEDGVYGLDVTATILGTDVELGDEPEDYWQPGYEAPFFWSKDAVIVVARREWLKHFPEGRVLLLGDKIYCDPQRVLAHAEGHEALAEQLTEIHARYEVGWGSGVEDPDDPAVVKQAQAEWERVLGDDA